MVEPYLPAWLALIEDMHHHEQHAHYKHFLFASRLLLYGFQFGDSE